MTATRSTPKDAQVMASILKEVGVFDYEPRILNQMLEFTYRYVTSILDDSQLYSSHAKKKNIDVEDVKLAISLQQEKNFTSPPAKELTAEMAKQRNSLPLPLIKSSAGLRLPPDRYSLTTCNYRLKSAAKKARTVHTVSRLNVANLPQNTVNKNNASINLNKPVPALSLVSKANTQPTPVIPRPTINIAKPVPTPIIKFSDGTRLSTPVCTLPSAPVVTSISTPNSVPVTQILMPTMGAINSDIKLPTDIVGQKRKHEEDDDYDE